MRVHAHTQKIPVGADCCCFVRLQNSHFYLESAQHTTSDDWRNILSCLFHSSRDDTDRKNRTGLPDKISPIPENNRSSRPDENFVVSRSCFLLTAAVAFPLLLLKYFSGCSSTARGPFTFTKKTLLQPNERTHKHTSKLRDCLLISLSLSPTDTGIAHNPDQGEADPFSPRTSSHSWWTVTFPYENLLGKKKQFQHHARPRRILFSLLFGVSTLLFSPY